MLLALLGNDWLETAVLSKLGLADRYEHAAVALLSVLCVMALLALSSRWVLSTGAAATGLTDALKGMPRTVAVREVRRVAPYLDVMSRQLDGGLQDIDRGMRQMIERIDSIHFQVSRTQFDRIRTSEANGVELTAVMKNKVMVDAQLGAILEMFVQKQEEDLRSNLERVQRLHAIKALAPLVDEITAVARQTNFLAINAAIEPPAPAEAATASRCWRPRFASSPTAPVPRRWTSASASPPPPWAWTTS
ncbi:MAG: hypothetical protein IPM99_19335 [Rubrivivax sp.]|nr:hypothetical protein [Rubrivivax sp.]